MERERLEPSPPPHQSKLYWSQLYYTNVVTDGLLWLRLPSAASVVEHGGREDDDDESDHEADNCPVGSGVMGRESGWTLEEAVDGP